MHIPDGFLAMPVWAGFDLASAASVGLLARRAERQVPEGTVPLLGTMGAFVFAAQMINFPVGPGTSGHIVGSALLACTLGPAAAAVVMTAILTVQALVFGDGGLLALGANVFNMGLAGVLAGYLPYHSWGRTSWRYASVFAGGVLSVMVSSSLALLELRLSGVAMPGAVLGLSVGLFAVSALIEGAITFTVFRAIERMNAEWVRPSGGESKTRGLLMAAVLLATVGALLASTMPDGLEALAAKVGIESRATNLIHTPLADYELQTLENPAMRKVAAGLVGLVAIYGVCAAVARFMGRRQA